MKIDSNFEFQIIILIIGDSGVGKTNFIYQFAEGKFNEMHVSTVGLDFKSKIIKLPKLNKIVKLQIWDTAGQERYMAINKNLFQKVEGIIIMYDISNRNSFENINKWLNLATQVTSNKTMMLVGNKLDLAKVSRVVSEREGEELAKSHRILFGEGSGCSGENVDKVFISIAEKIFQRLMDDKSEDLNTNVNINKEPIKEKQKCC